MLGQVVPCGTGDTILLLDNDQLDDIEGEVAKKIEAGVISLGADMILIWPCSSAHSFPAAR
jgi:hypothetical protein